jgi:hypothetical protein
MKMRNVKKVLGIVMIALLFASCSTVKVHTDLDSSVDFSKYKNFEYYGWADGSDKILNDLDKRRIEKAFADELYKRGMGYVAKDGDMVVALYIVTETKTQTTATTTSMGGGYGGYGGYYGYGPGYGWGAGHSTTQVSSYDYQVGTLVISMYDTAKEQLIWESSASGELNDPDKREKSIPYVVSRIMKDYPVPIPKEK